MKTEPEKTKNIHEGYPQPGIAIKKREREEPTFRDNTRTLKSRLRKLNHEPNIGKQAKALHRSPTKTKERTVPMSLNERRGNT